MAAAIKAAELGRRTCIVEAGIIGGTCVNIGCVPSKTLIRTAEAYHRAGHHPFTGVRTWAEGLDWKAVIGQKDQLVGELRQTKYVDVLASYGDLITLVRGRARLQADGTVALDNGQSIKAGGIVVATGAEPRILSLDGIESVEVLTSTSAMALEKQPRTLLVIGGRAVALELGQTFARFGTRVTILQRSPRIIPEHEPEIAGALADYLHEEGLAIHAGVQLLAIRQDDGEKVVTAQVNGQRHEFRAEQVLMAVGRTPHTNGLGLEEVGIELDAGGFIVVDDYMQTSHPRIYAAGDVTNRPKLVYVAAAAGGIAAENALNGNGRQLDLRVLPDVIFTDPQVATVGLTEVQARANGYDLKVTTLPLAYVPRALAARDTRGLIKLVADGATGQLLGAHVLAAEGGEMIQAAALAIKFGATIDDLTGTLFPYLTRVEGLKLAAQTFDKDLSKLSCCAA
jgi:mercuric reductase